MTQRIILIGYRATGKTTLAVQIAQRLGWRWIDADVVIEERAGKTIAEIFAQDGEPAFRDLEEQVIADLCGEPNLVLATGGGAPMRESTQQRIRKAGKVIWLTADPETVHRRITGDETTADRRPRLCEDKDPLQEIVSLLEKREPVYRETAHIEIDTVDKTVDALTDEIMAAIDEG